MTDNSKRLFPARRLAAAGLAVALLAGCASSEEKAKSHYESAVKFLAEHDNARASVEFKNALRFKKDYVEAWRGLAQTEEEGRRWGGVVAALRNLIELQPNDIPARLKLARLVSLGGSIDEAMRLIDGAQALDEKNADVLAVKASLLFRLNDVDGAVRTAKTALELDPKNLAAIIVLAAERSSRGDPKGALALLDSAGDVKDLGIQLFKLKIFEQTQDLPQAEALLKRMAEVFPDQPEFRRQLVRLYLSQKRLDDAESAERAVAAARPEDTGTGLELVRFLLAVRGAAPAREELAALIQSSKDAFPFKLALAEFEFTQNNTAEGVRQFEALIAAAGETSEHVIVAQAKLAEYYLATKQTEAAEKLVTSILSKDARNTSGLKLRATIRMGRGEVETAIDDLRQALADQPRATDLMLMLAVAYERSGSIDLAEKQFADATKTSNFNPGVGLAYVGFLQRRGSLERAEDVVTELTNRAPKNIELLSALAQIRLLRQNWTGAQEVADAIRKLGNDRGVADQIQGTALSGMNKLEESAAAFENAYKAAPAATQPMFALVRAFVRAQKLDKATEFLQSVLKSSPDNAEALVLLGSVQLMSKAPDQAIRSFQLAVAKQPKNMIGYRALADYYIGQRNIGKAREVVQAGLKENPDNMLLRLSSAGLMELAGEVDAAIAEYEKILLSDPSSLVASNNLASLLADNRDDKASLSRAQALATALRKSPVPQFKDTIGWVSYRQGDYKAATPLLEEAAAALPGQPLIRYHLGMSYMAAGAPDKASEQFKLALDQAPNATLADKIRTAMKKLGS